MSLNKLHATGLSVSWKYNETSGFTMNLNGAKKETSAMKWVTDTLTNKPAECWYSCLSISVIGMLSYSWSALVLSLHYEGIKFQCFLI